MGVVPAVGLRGHLGRRRGRRHRLNVGNHVPRPDDLNHRPHPNLVLLNELGVESRSVLDGHAPHPHRHDLDTGFQVPVFGRGPDHIHHVGLRHLVRQDHLECEAVVGVARGARINAVVRDDDAVDFVHTRFAPLLERLRQGLVGNGRLRLVLNHHQVGREQPTKRRQFGHLLRGGQVLRFDDLVGHKIHIANLVVHRLGVGNARHQITGVGELFPVFGVKHGARDDELPANDQPTLFGQFQVGDEVGNVLAHFAVTAGIQFRLGALSRVQARHPVQFTRNHVGTRVFLFPLVQRPRIGLDLVHRPHLVGKFGLVFLHRRPHFLENRVLREFFLNIFV